MTTGDLAPRTGDCEQFFGFREPPFSLAPNPRFLFESTSHGEALSQVAHALERREPVVVITGEIGSGKTMLCRTVLQRARRKTFVSVVNDPLLERDDLLKQLLEDFGVISKDRTKLAPTTRHDLVHALEHFLASLIPLQAHAVVIIDEAQHLKPDVLEQIRLLSNIDDARGTMLQIILVGQTDLEPLLSRPELRQFQQRVSRRFRLEPLSPAEVKQYVEHRLAVARGVGEPAAAMPGATELERALIEWDGGTNPAGGSGVTFTDEALQEVARRSSGLPRLINILCDRALESACAVRSRTIDAAAIAAAAQAIGGATETVPAPAAGASFWSEEPVPFTLTPPAAPSHRNRNLVLIAAAAAIAAVAVWVGMQAMRSAEPETPPSVSTPATATPGTRPSPASQTPPTATPSPGATASAPQTAQPAPGATAPPAPARNAASPSATASAAPSAADAPAQRFEIVVASFRTEARATAVAAGVQAVGLPVRQRESDGWQQVLAGPFRTRGEAEAAQQKLLDSGFGGTQITPSVR